MISAAQPLAAPLVDKSPNLAMIWSLLVILFEIASVAAIAYVLKYTVQHRSGLNEPEKLQRIWSRSEEIRFQPVFKSMIFSIAVAHGAPAIFSFVVSVAFAIIGFPGSFFRTIQTVLNLGVVFLCACIGPMIYHASGGQRTTVNVIALLSFSAIMIYLIIYESVADLAKNPKYVDSQGAVWIAYFVAPIVLTAMQVPFALWGAARQFPSAARIYSSNPVPDWVRLNKTIGLATVPLVVVRLLVLWIHLGFGDKTYLARISYYLADAMLFSVAGLAAVISVNRALLAEDFRWQWRSFLTPAIPLGVCDLVITLFGGAFLQTDHFMTRLFLVVQHITIYGSVGSLGAYLYLYLAEQYAQEQLGDFNQSIGDEIFDESDEDNQLHSNI